MKHERIGIKWKIFLYLLGFTAFLLVLLWVIQTVYLEDFYKTIKKNELENALDNVKSVLEDEDAEEAVELIASSYDICVVVTDIYGNQLYSSDQNMQCSIHKLRKDQLKDIIEQAVINDGSYSIESGNDDNNILKHDMEMGGYFDRYNDRFEPDRFNNMPDHTDAESTIRADVVTLSNDREVVVMINTIITPVDATVHTLRIQLIYISVIMVVLSLVLALIISWRISKPIVKINESAKKLGEGDYDVQFDGTSYKEVAELSKTLNQTTEELAKAEGLQRELLANVSHDLRTPLTMITAYSEVMRDLPGENTPENVQVIIDEAKRLTNLVNDLLDVSKLQAGVSQLELKEYDLTNSIETVLQRYSKFVEQNGYIIDFKYDRHINVVADEYKMFQVIYNLVNNAINYSGESKTVYVRQSVFGEIARIEVIDTGEGISADELNNVWERYYKIDKSHKRAVMGTGLGLSIVKNILKLHNVQFGVSSEPEKGTTFWFEMKIV